LQEKHCDHNVGVDRTKDFCEKKIAPKSSDFEDFLSEIVIFRQ
jgi:hypothetical protein